MGCKAKEYLIFEDNEVWSICCNNYGDYKEVVVTDNGDNTVDIATTPVSMMNTTANRGTTVTQHNVDNTGGTYVAGTTKVPVGITIEQCAAVTTLGQYGSSGAGPFKNNTNITAFLEFQYFTGVTSLTYGATNGNWIFYGCTSLTKLKIPRSITSTGSGGNGLRGLSSLVFVDFPDTTAELKQYTWAFGGNQSKTIICRAVTPPPTVSDGPYGYKRFYGGLYVPDESVEDYKTAANWSAYASYVRPLSQFDTDYPNGYE